MDVNRIKARHRDERRTTAIAYAGETITVTYRPFAEEIADALAVPPDARTREVLVPVLGRVLLAWDLRDDAGHPAPLTPAALQGLPGDLVQALWDGLTTDLLQRGVTRGSPALARVLEQRWRRADARRKTRRRRR